MAEQHTYMCPWCRQPYPLDDLSITGSEVTCAGCGKAFVVQPGAAPAVTGPARTSALAIVSMVIGIVGATVSLCLAPVTIGMGMLALVLGLIALGKIRRHPALRGKGFAIAGVSLGSADLLLGGLMMVVFLQAISSVMDNAKITHCSNNQIQLMNMAYHHSVTKDEFPDARGNDFWKQIAADLEDPDPADAKCPITRKLYRGPAQNPNEMPETAAFSVCEHGEGKGVNILLKSGDMHKVPFGSPEHKRALEETVD